MRPLSGHLAAVYKVDRTGEALPRAKQAQGEQPKALPATSLGRLFKEGAHPAEPVHVLHLKLVRDQLDQVGPKLRGDACGLWG